MRDGSCHAPDRGQPLGLLALGFLAPGGQLDLELRLGLGPLGFALLQDALRLAAHLIRLPLGGGEDLVPFPLGRRLELGHFTLGGGPQLGDVALDGRPLLSERGARRRPQLGHFALGRGSELVRLPAGARPDRVGLALRRPALVISLALGDRPQLSGLVLGRRPHLGGVHLGGGLDLVGLGPGGLDQLGGLLLSQPEQLLDPGTQTGVGRPFLLLQLAVGIGQLLVHRLDLILLRAQVPLQRGQVLVDLLGVVTAHHLGELARLRVFKEVGELCVNVGLHVA